MKNRVNLIGRLGKDAITTVLDNGKKKTTFSVATTDHYKDDKGEKQESTEWHRCTLWGQDNLLPYLTQGVLIDLEGKLHYGSYEKDGVTHYTTEVVVFDILLLPSARTEQKQS